MAKLFLAVGSIVGFLLTPDHQLVDQSLGLVSRDVGKREQELIKGRIGSSTTDLLDGQSVGVKSGQSGVDLLVSFGGK